MRKDNFWQLDTEHEAVNSDDLTSHKLTLNCNVTTDFFKQLSKKSIIFKLKVSPPKQGPIITKS